MSFTTFANFTTFTTFFMFIDLFIRNCIIKITKNNYLFSLSTAEKLTSIIHNFITLYFAKSVIYDNAFWVDTYSRINHVSDSSYMVGYVSGGYFLYELLISIIRFNTSESVYILHAIIGIIVYCINTYNKDGHLYGALFIMFELSTPFVHARWFLRNCYNNNNNNNILKLVMLYNDAILITVFFIVRILWGLYCAYYLISDMKYAHTYLQMSIFKITIHLLPMVTSTCLNFYWFHLMVLKLIKFLRTRILHRIS